MLEHKEYSLNLTYEFEAKLPENLNVIPIPLMPALILDRLSSDYNKSLKNILQTSHEYSIRLPDELPLINTLNQGVKYYQLINDETEAAHLLLIILELQYLYINFIII